LSALDEYLQMSAKERGQVLLAEYRCRKRCLLLHIWQAPSGRNFYLPRYRLSPAVTESETAESARRKRTEDGYKIWRGRAGSMEELDVAGLPPGIVTLTVTCDHVRENLAAEAIAADITAARPGAPAKILIPRGVS
jgi:hypothetical protein